MKLQLNMEHPPFFSLYKYCKMNAIHIARASHSFVTSVIAIRVPGKFFYQLSICYVEESVSDSLGVLCNYLV